MALPRETGGNVPRPKVKPPARPIAQRQTYVAPPKPRVQPNPDTRAPVSASQRQAINRNAQSVRGQVKLNQYLNEHPQVAKQVKQGTLKADADAINRGSTPLIVHDPATGLSVEQRGLSGHSQVIVSGGKLIHRYTTYLGLGHHDVPLVPLTNGGYAETATLDAATQKITAPVVKALHIAAIPGEAIGHEVQHLTGSKAAGVAGSFLLDPTTYLTAGRARVAEDLAAKEADRIAAKASAAGLTAEQAQRMGGRAAARALKTAPQARGVQLGVRVHIPLTDHAYEAATSGATSAHLLGSPAAEKLTAPLRNFLHETVAPDVRPSHLTQGEHDTIRGARRDFRAQQAAGLREAIKLHTAIKSAIPEAAHQRQVIDALESRTVDRLPNHLRPVAATLRKRFDVAYKQEAKRGLARGKLAPQGPTDAQGYFPHVGNEGLELAPGKVTKTRTRVEPSYGRSIRKPLAQIRQEVPHLFSEDVAQVAAHRTAKSSERVALSDLWQRVADAGRPLKPDTHIELGSGDAVYKVTPHGLEELGANGKPDLKAIGAAVDGKASGRFVVLHRGAVEDIKKGIGATGVGDTLPERAFDRTQGFLKIAMTIPNPAYHMRNLYGDLHNAYLGDATAKGVARSLAGMRTLHARESFRGSAAAARGEADPHVEALLNRSLNLGHGEQSTMGRELQLAEQHGAIRTGQAGSEFRDLMGGNPKTLGRIRAASEYREDLPRFATYLSARMRGLSPAEAADWSRFHHVAYDDLTDFERRVARRFVPFYTWFARNSRIQATKLLTRPGKAATLGKLFDLGAQQAGYSNYEDYAKKNLASYQQQGLPFPVKVDGKVFNVYTGLPVTDLNQLSLNPTEQAFNVANRATFFKAIPELIANYSTFFRGPIQNDQAPLVPAPDVVGDLPQALRDKLGIQKFLDKRSGKHVWGWPAKVDYVARQLPQSNFLSQFGTSVAGSRGYDRKLGAVSYLTGVKVAQADPLTTSINDAYSERTTLTNKLGALRQRLGKTPDGHYRKTAETDALNKQIKALDGSIGQLRTKRGDPPESIPLNERAPKVKTPAQVAHDLLYGAGSPRLEAQAKHAHDLLYGAGSPKLQGEIKKAHQLMYGK